MRIVKAENAYSKSRPNKVSLDWAERAQLAERIALQRRGAAAGQELALRGVM